MRPPAIFSSSAARAVLGRHATAPAPASAAAAAVSRGATATSAASWACTRCCRSSPLAGRVASGGPRFFSSAAARRAPSRRLPPPPPPPPPRSRRRRAIILTASGGTAAATLLAFTDDIKQGYETAERAGRVATGLALCINDYRKTLNRRDAIDDAAEKEALLRACHKRCAERTLRVLEKNGGIFIKLGQHLSAMTYLLPSEWTTTFIPLQDRCPVSSFASVEALYRADTGKELWEDFSAFAAEPIGAASLAQVHLATVRATGEQVAVKVQHPAVAQWAPLDMALTTFTFSTLKRYFPEYDLEWLASEMAESLPQELDFEREAANARRTQAHFAALPRPLPLVVPRVLLARRRLLVMACEAGHRLDDLAYLDAHAIDRDAVSAALAHIFNEMIFGDGAPLHCDPHGGNLAVRARAPAPATSVAGLLARLAAWLPFVPRAPNFDIILYDHGLYRDIPLALRRSYAKLWLAVLDGDLPRMQHYAHAVAGVDAQSFPLFASAITGRDFRVLQSASVLQPRTDDEREHMGGQLQEGLLADLVQLLGRVPRVILLILKTNDLTRSLDEGLHTRLGPVGAFLVMAQYCLRTVRDEQVDAVLGPAPGPGPARRRRRRDVLAALLWPPSAAHLLAAYAQYVHGLAKLRAFGLWLRARRFVGIEDSFSVGL